MKIDAGFLSQELLQQIDNVLDALGLVETRKGVKDGRRECKAPWINHGEISIYTAANHPQRGAWIHWGSGEKGDLFDLVGCCMAGGVKDRKAAYDWAKRFLGYDREYSAEEKREFLARQAHAKKVNEINAEKRAKIHQSDLNKKRRRAKAIYLKGAIVQPGDRVYQYLTARGIDFKRLQHVPKSIRFLEKHAWNKDIKFDCMVCGMYLPNSELGAIHRTWLDPDDMGKKAPIYIEKHDGTKAQKARKIWPEFEGCFIPLWRGKSGKNRKDAPPKSDTIIICEGVEDGLTLAMLYPDARIDVVGSLGNMRHYDPPACCKELVIAADRDWGKDAALEQLEKTKEILAIRGQESPVKPVRFKVKCMFPPAPYKDFNDALLRKK